MSAQKQELLEMFEEVYKFISIITLVGLAFQRRKMDRISCCKVYKYNFSLNNKFLFLIYRNCKFLHTQEYSGYCVFSLKGNFP